MNTINNASQPNANISAEGARMLRVMKCNGWDWTVHQGVRYEYNSKTDTLHMEEQSPAKVAGDALDFAASEAYPKLR